MAAIKATPLANPVNDAHLMASNLEKLGFKVILKTDATQQVMDDSIVQFGRQLEDGGVGLFFYAGHGIQSKGRNYLIPVNAQLQREKDLKYKAVDAGTVLDEMGNANNGLNIVVLDACRDNPLSRDFRSTSRGLTRIDDVPTGTLIAYSTAQGKVAVDGDGKNSPYTKALVGAMKQPGRPLLMVFQDVLKRVKKETGGKQVPWFDTSVEGDFYFSGEGANIPASAQVSGGVPDMAGKHEIQFWDDIKAAPSKEMYEAYLEEYPNGHYERIARIKLKQYGKLIPSREKSVQQALRVCETHFKANRLTTGRGGNAMECYEQVLINDPSNQAALKGFIRIENKYAGWAERQIKREKFSSAKNNLKKIAVINSESEQLLRLNRLLEKQQADSLKPLKWNLIEGTKTDNSTIEISDVNSSSFSFQIFAIAGGNIGDLSGKAKRIDSHKAIYRDTGNCEVIFKYRADFLTVRTSGCSGYTGMGVSVDGHYAPDVEPENITLEEAGVFKSSHDENVFKSVVLEHYDLFLISFNLYSKRQDLDDLNAEVWSGGVRGLFTIMEAIIMTHSDGTFWAAVIDDDVVRYFTNGQTYQKHLPKTIEKWRENFPGNRIVFQNKTG